MKKFLIATLAIITVAGLTWFACHFTQKTQHSFKEVAEANDFSVNMEKHKASAVLPGKTRAERALWLQLGEQLSFRRRDNPTFSTNMITVEAAYTYVRLSELAKEKNDDVAANELLEDAIALCKLSRMSPDCRSEDLQKFVRILDGKIKP